MRAPFRSHDPADLLELRRAGGLAPLEQRGLGRREHGAGRFHPPQGGLVIEVVPRSHRIDGHVYPPAIGQQVEHRLLNADVGFDAADQQLFDVPLAKVRKQLRQLPATETELGRATVPAGTPVRGP